MRATMADRQKIEQRVAKWRAAQDSDAVAVTLPSPWPLIRDLWEMLEESEREWREEIDLRTGEHRWRPVEYEPGWWNDRIIKPDPAALKAVGAAPEEKP